MGAVASAPLLALGSALGFAVAGVFLKRGLQHASPLAATLVSVTVTAAVICGLAFATGDPLVALTPAIAPFLVAGLIAPGLARLAMFVGVHRIGIARSSSVLATAPLVSMGIAIAVLGEQPSPTLLVGAGAIVAGGILLAHRSPDDRSWRRRDMLFPALAALGFALRDNITRWGFRHFAHPVVAGAAAAVCSVAVMYAVGAAARTRGGMRLEAGALGLLALAGLAEGAAYLAMWWALSIGDVSVVSPLVNAQSIFAVTLAAVFLRDLERVTWRVALAAVLLIGGVAAVGWLGAP